MKTEDQGYISYNKAPLALFALQELIGADKVNGALRAYHARSSTRSRPSRLRAISSTSCAPWRDRSIRS